ncbi:MAG TPA: protein kinase [Polyangia bacterium]|nr:protein kinase [Polyangia bacterium]
MKFGQYELLELIAVGGMAEVFKGRAVAAEGFEKLVAIKRILPDLAEDDRFVKMLLTEARIHSALSHRNIVQIHDLGISEDGQYFIVLEYVDGFDLRIISEQLAAAGQILPEALSLHVASEVAQGLHFAHELRGPDGQPLGLIHRDVTPSNILVSLAGEVKLSDFGLAKRRHDRSVVGSLKGNLSYMSPEQAKQSSLDRRTDVFSLGAVLFELLTGRRLREITDEIAGWSHVASGAVPSARALRPDLPPAVGELLDRALAADPDVRFPDAATFGTAIREAMAGMNAPVGATDLAALLRALDPPRRPRTLINEHSKVIRLGPEARALREAIEAPTTPAPVPLPIRPRHSTGSRSVTGAPATALAAVPDPAATPSPATPPPRSRSQTPLVPAAPPPVRHTPAMGRSAVSGPLYAVAPSLAPAPRLSPPRPFPIPVSSPGFAPRRQPRETARVQPLRTRSRRRLTTFLFLAMLVGGAVAVHRFVVPLDVLVTWPKPARLAISTEPPGAKLRLDGVLLSSASPTVVQVRRDLIEHVLEATHEGFRPAEATLRYDKTVRLSATLVLQPLPAPAALARPPVPPIVPHVPAARQPPSRAKKRR